jgi:hypothetical protein
VIVTLAVEGVGDIGVLPFPHAIAAASNISAKVIRLQTDMIDSFPRRDDANGLPGGRCEMRAIYGSVVTAGLRKTRFMTQVVSHPRTLTVPRLVPLEIDDEAAEADARDAWPIAASSGASRTFAIGCAAS